MELLKSVSLECPYCGETIEVLIDCTVLRQEYIEDCQVCCKPISISVRVEDDDTPQVEARQEDE
jgi:hypothetical protein